MSVGYRSRRACAVACTMTLGGFGGGVAGAQPVSPALPPTSVCAPRTLTSLVVRDISPGVASADPRAQPRTMIRRGTTQFRSEEQPDPGRAGETRIVIVSEPDIWSIDLAQRRGAHSVDPGPELIVKAPVLPITPEMPALFRTLEFGCEAEFVATHTPATSQTGSWGVSQVGVHQLTEGDHSVAFLMDIKTGKPVIITYSRAGKMVFAMRYDAWRNDQPNDPSLFVPPKSVQIIEAPAATPKP